MGLQVSATLYAGVCRILHRPKIAMSKLGPEIARRLLLALLLAPELGLVFVPPALECRHPVEDCKSPQEHPRGISGSCLPLR
jgi:hypothetical protein